MQNVIKYSTCIVKCRVFDLKRVLYAKMFRMLDVIARRGSSSSIYRSFLLCSCFFYSNSVIHSVHALASAYMHIRIPTLPSEPISASPVRFLRCVRTCVRANELYVHKCTAILLPSHVRRKQSPHAANDDRYYDRPRRRARARHPVTTTVRGKSIYRLTLRDPNDIF